MPYLIAFLAVSCYALLGPIAKKVGMDLPPFTFIATSSIILAVPAAFIGYFFERDKILSSEINIHWNWLIAFSLINLVGYVLYLLAIRRLPIAQYDMFGIMMPIIGGLFAVFLLKEPFHARYLASLLFMAVGLYIAVGPEIRGTK